MELLTIRDIDPTTDECPEADRMDVDKSIHMVESFLTIVLSLIGFHKLTGRHSLETDINLEKEIIVILATKTCGHAEILRNVPGGDPNEPADGITAAPHTVDDIDKILADIADFNPGAGFQQGTYKLNAKGWEKFDPVYLLHRSIQLKDFEMANANYISYMKEKIHIFCFPYIDNLYRISIC